MRIRDTGEPDRPSLVLIHGLASSSDCWQRVQEQLAAGRRLVTVDLFTRNAHRFAIEAAAQELAVSLSSKGIKRVDVVGHSLGALVALALARTSMPVDRLVLVSMPSELRKGGGLRRFAGMLGSLRRTELSAIAMVIGSSLRSSPLGLLAATRATLAANPDQMLVRLAVPTLLVWGADDPIVPLPEGRRLHDRLSGSRLAVITGAGHQPMWDDARDFVRVVRPFLTAVVDA